MDSNIYGSTVMPEDLDMKGRMTIPAIYRKVISSISLNIRKEGYGVDVLFSRGLTWVLARFAMEIDIRPAMYENLEMGIWKGIDSGVLHDRYVEVVSKETGRIGRVFTQWCIMDRESHKPVRVNLTSDLKRMDAPCRQPRRMKPFTGGKTSIGRAEYSECDFNGHLNNGRYIDRFFDLLPDGILSVISPVRLDVNFKSEVPCGAMTVSSVMKVKEGEYGFCMYHEGSVACCASFAVL